MLEYDDFYRVIWTDYISQSDISLKYRKENAEFLKHLTFSLWRKYQKVNVSEYVFAETIKIMFKDLFDYRPSLIDDGDIVDFNRG